MNQKLMGFIDGIVIFIIIFGVVIGTFIIGNLEKIIEIVGK